MNLEGIKKKIVREAAILTNSYVAGEVVHSTPDMNQLIIELDFTKGSLTSLELKVEFSQEEDGDYYQETAKSTTGGVETDTLVIHQITDTGKYRLAIPIMDHYIKISAKSTGTVTGSSLAVNAKIGQV